MGDVAAKAGAANDYNAKVAGQAGKALARERQAEAERDSALNGHEEPYQPVPKRARSYAQPFYNRLEDGDPRHGGDHRQKGRGKGKGKGQGKTWRPSNFNHRGNKGGRGGDRQQNDAPLRRWRGKGNG